MEGHMEGCMEGIWTGICRGIWAVYGVACGRVYGVVHGVVYGGYMEDKVGGREAIHTSSLSVVRCNREWRDVRPAKRSTCVVEANGADK